MPPLCSYSQLVELASPWPGELAKGPPRPPSSSLLPYSANVKLTARLSALAVRKIGKLNLSPVLRFWNSKSLKIAECVELVESQLSENFRPLDLKFVGKFRRFLP